MSSREKKDSETNVKVENFTFPVLCSGYVQEIIDKIGQDDRCIKTHARSHTRTLHFTYTNIRSSNIASNSEL